MNMSNKLVVPISGLHCRACELLTEDKLREVKNIKKVDVNHQIGQAVIYYEGEKPGLEKINSLLQEIGYGVGEDKPEKTNTGGNQLSNIISVIAAVIIVYWLINKINLFDLSNWLNGSFSWPLAILVGLIAGVSTCLALVGGLVLGVAANHAKKNPNLTGFKKFQPHLIFNLGRILGFFILGGFLGLLGTTFKLSSLFNSILTIIVGLVIIILGLKLINIFPIFNKFDLTLPKSWGRKIKTNNPWLLGALTFFLPCGFTQAMQIYALGSGSFWQGGLIMALFALGTAPGLLGIGGLTSFFGQKKSKLFFQIAGIIVIAFGLFNLGNGYRLFQVSTAFSATPRTSSNYSQNKDSLEIKDGVQIVRMTEHNRGYSPNQFTIVKERPVRWIIQADAPYSCASALIVPSLKISKQLKPGENIIEFTPTQLGNIPFSCSMGMYTGNFRVVANEEDLSSESPETIIANQNNNDSGGCGSSGSCGCGSQNIDNDTL